MKDITYIACPYTDADPNVRAARFEAVTRFAAKLIAAGEVVYSPISHSHAITRTGLPIEWEFWRRQDLTLLRASSGLLVYCLDGWQTSTGVQAEIEAAEEWGIPIRYCQPEQDLGYTLDVCKERSDMSENERFDCFAIVEVMGHQTYAGRVSEQTIGGCALVRVDVAPQGERPGYTKLLGQGAIFAITPCSEDVARTVAEQSYNRPITIYDPPSNRLTCEDEGEDYD